MSNPQLSPRPNGVNMTVSDNQVVIVGAGPVGLMAAHRLSEFGVPCTVLEAEADIADELRASTIHPPTLDMLEDYGLAQPLIDQGRICPTWQIRVHETHERVEFDLAILAKETRHPFRLQCEQVRLSRLLLERLRRAGDVQLMFGARVERIEQTDDGVVAHATKDGEAVTVAGRLLIGADGARSIVRSQMAMPFEGRTYPETTILATTKFPFEDHLPGLAHVNYVWTQSGHLQPAAPAAPVAVQPLSGRGREHRGRADPRKHRAQDAADCAAGGRP